MDTARPFSVAPAPAPRIPAGVKPASVLMALLFLSMAIVSPTVDALVRTPFGLTNDQVAPFWAVHSLPQILLLSLVAGLFSDRIGRRTPLIVTGVIGTGITTALLPHIPSWPVLLGVRFLDGLFGIMAISLLMTRVVDLTTEENRPLGIGMLMAAIPAGYLSGMGLTALLTAEQLVPLFGIAGGLLVAGGIWMLPAASRPEPIRATQAGLRDTLRALADLPRLWLPFLFGFVDKFTFAAIASLLALAVTDIYGLDAAVWSSLALAVYWVCFLAGTRPAGRICARYGSLACVVAGSALYGGALLALMFVPFWMFVVLMGAAGFFTALQFVPTLSIVGDLSGETRRGTNVAAFNIVGSLGMITGFWASASLSEIGTYASAFGTAGVLEMLCALIGGAVLLRMRKNHTPAAEKSRLYEVAA